jgi:2-haloacid dehalogenase
MKFHSKRQTMINLYQFEVLTFDCYGTLIDWETGIWQALRPVLAAHGKDIQPEQALELYGELESAA